MIVTMAPSKFITVRNIPNVTMIFMVTGFAVFCIISVLFLTLFKLAAGQMLLMLVVLSYKRG